MRAWFDRFLTTIEASLSLQIRVGAIFVVPTIILLFGASQVGGVSIPAARADVVAAASKTAAQMYFVSALISAVWCFRVALKEYRRVHKRIFGH